MTAAQVWTISGLALVAIGIYMGVEAFRRTNAEYGSGPLFRTTAMALALLRRQYKRLIPGKPIVVNIGQAIETDMALPIRVIQSGLSANEDASVDEQLRAMRKAFQRIDDELTYMRNHTGELHRELNTSVGEHIGDLRRDDQALRGLVHEAVAGTVRIQVWGLIFVALGTAIMAVPSVFRL